MDAYSAHYVSVYSIRKLKCTITSVNNYVSGGSPLLALYTPMYMV